MEHTNLVRLTDTPSKVDIAKTYPLEWIEVTDNSAMINIKTESYMSGKKHTTSTLLLIDFNLGMFDR